MFYLISFSRPASHRGATDAPHHIAGPILLTHTAYRLYLSISGFADLQHRILARISTGVGISSVHALMVFSFVSCCLLICKQLLSNHPRHASPSTQPQARAFLLTVNHCSKLFLDIIVVLSGMVRSRQEGQEQMCGALFLTFPAAILLWSEIQWLPVC